MACTFYSRSIGWVPVDVFIKETTKDVIDIADHPVEAGGTISDHAWIKPRELIISGVISGGSMTGYETLRRLQTTLEPFEIISGFSIYSNMLLQTLTASRDNKTGQVCAFDATCREVMIVSTAESQSDASGYDRAVGTVNRGQVQGRPTSVGGSRGSSKGSKTEIMTIIELPIISAPSQQFTTVLSNRLCLFTVNYSETSNRWSFDLAIENEPVITGRRIVLGVDLVEPFNLGIGAIHAMSMGPDDVEPGRKELPSGHIQLVQVTE